MQLTILKEVLASLAASSSAEGQTGDPPPLPLPPLRGLGGRPLKTVNAREAELWTRICAGCTPALMPAGWAAGCVGRLHHCRAHQHATGCGK
jgi:hypothetical protein